MDDVSVERLRVEINALERNIAAIGRRFPELRRQLEDQKGSLEKELNVLQREIEAAKSQLDKPAGESSMTSSAMERLFKQRLELAEDLEWLLTKVDDRLTIAILKALQSRHSGMQLGRYLKFVKTPNQSHRKVFGRALNDEDAAVVIACSDSFLIDQILNATVENEFLTCKDGQSIREVMTKHHPATVKAFLDTGWGSDEKISWGLAILPQLMAQGNVEVDELFQYGLALVEVQPTRDQVKEFFRLLRNVNVDELVQCSAQLQQFLIGAQHAGRPLLSYGRPLLQNEDMGLCLYVAKNNLAFADWFISHELVEMPEEKDDRFVDYLEAIALAWQRAGVDDSDYAVSANVKAVLDHEWATDPDHMLSGLSANMRHDNNLKQRIKRIEAAQRRIYLYEEDEHAN